MVGVGELQIKNQSNELYISTIDDNVTNLESIPENEVYIYRDIYGIPHIYADSNYDMFFGEGYAQAEDHLEGMLKNYLLSIGQMSSVFGENYLMSDHQVRLLKVLSTVQEKYLELSLNSRVTLESFAAGVNFYMSQNPEKTPTWSFTVTPQMVGAVMKLVVLKRPLGRLFKEIQYGTGIKLDSLFESSNKESNEWVVGPEKTKNSYAMLQTDPHLPWFDINSWWEVHLDGPDYHVAGCSLWGFPGVILGHTDKVAWSWTANSPDTADAYLELIRNNNGYEYFYDGQWLDVEVIKETIQVADSNPVEKTFYYTHHGPIVYFDNDYTIAGKMSTWLEVGMIDQILE